MAIYDNLPYTNFHELNADWLLKQMKEAKAKIDEYQEVLDQFEEDYQVLLALSNALSISGSNVTVAGSLTANGLIGNLTGNVTGNLTGNAATATLATSADSATNATNATNATTADKSTMAYALKDYWPTGDTLDNAIPDNDSQLTKIYIGNGLGGRPADLNSSANIVCMVTHTATAGGTKKYQQILWNDQNQHTYYRVISVASDNTKSYTSWTVDVPAEALHATSADSATTANSATTATTATKATNATNANYAVSAGSIPSYPNLGSSNYNYVTTMLNTVSFAFCLGNAQNRPTGFASGAIVIVTKFNLGGNTYISQYAFNAAYQSGDGDGNAIAMRYGYATGEDKDPQDDEFTWVTWRYLVGASA